MAARESVAETGTAEGATAPESLRQKDRAVKDTLESGCRRRCRATSHRRGKPARSAGRRKLSGPGDRGGIGTIRPLVRDRDRYVPELAMSESETDPSPRRLAPRPRRAHGARSPAMRCRSNMRASSPSICGRGPAPACSTSAIWASSSSPAPTREKGLESLLPADLTILKDGRLRYSLLLNAEGGIIDDLMVTRRGDHFYLVVNGATKDGDIAHLEARLPRSVVARPYEGAGPARAAGAEGGRRRWRGWRRASTQLGFMTGGRVRDRRRQGLDQPLGLYRRGRVRNLDPGPRRRDGSPTCSPTSPR